MRQLILLSACLFLASGCILRDTVEIDVVIPEYPSSWDAVEGNALIELSYFSENRITMLSGLEAGREIKLEIEKGVCPFAAYPVLNSGGVRLKPAGGIFPADFDGEKLNLSWENGFASEIILKLSERGICFSNFNVRRFEDCLLEKSGGNPWRVSETVLAFSLASGIFNSNHVTLRPSFDILMSDSFLSGRWLLADPLEYREIDSPEGSMELEDIYTGQHAVFSCSSPELKYAEIFVEDEMWTAFFSGGSGGLSGEL